jgi:hypothetical protein
MSRFIWVFIILVAIILVGISVQQAFQPDADTAGWIQVAIAALGVPILLRELYQIRQSINQKPIISIGLANVKDLPLSNVRATKSLKPSLEISHGYPHFWLIIRNTGKVTAKSVKIRFEFTRSTHQDPLLQPVIRTEDWMGDKRYTFKIVNNADFVFIGGTDWVLHANDTDMFDFYITTSIVKGKQRERPDFGDYEFRCTAWADGLDNPVIQNLTVSIIDKL